LETLMPFLGQIMEASSIDLATKELVIMRVSQINGCRYCLAAHHGAALAAGVGEVHYAFPVTETFAQRNQNTTVEGGLATGRRLEPGVGPDHAPAG